MFLEVSNVNVVKDTEILGQITGTGQDDSVTNVHRSIATTGASANIHKDNKSACKFAQINLYQSNNNGIRFNNYLLKVTP